MGPRYTDQEYELLKSDKTDEELAEILHRSLKGIKQQRYRVNGKSKQYERFCELDATALIWNIANVNKYRDELKIGEEVTVKYSKYPGGDRKITDSAVIEKKYPYVCKTDKGYFQYVDLMRWKIGGDFD